MGHRTAPEGYRVLICAPFGRDGATVQELLQADGYTAATCSDLDQLAVHLDPHTGAVMVTEEALGGSRTALERALSAQPPWSDVPFIVLATPQSGRRPPVDALRDRLPLAIASALVLERPLGRRSLLSATASALRTRQKQFQMRDRLAEVAAGREALAHSEAKSEAIADSIDQMIWSTRPDGFHDYYNQRWYDFTGMPEGSTDGEAWSGMFHPDDQERAWTAWRHSLRTGEPYHIEYRLRHRSGAYRWVLGRAQAVRDEAGRIARWYGTCTDIEEIVAAREVLARSRAELEALVMQRTADLEAEVARRDEAEAALRQAQKMEAVGQLTGGLAHDFNNLLAGISGSLELLGKRVAEGRTDRVERYLSAAQDAAQRAAALTHRLLAFSRRQTLDPRLTDVNGLVQGMAELIQRAVGPENAIEVVAQPDLWPARVDASQLENALLNLCINARDAMPNGGSIIIETANRHLDARAARARDMQPGAYLSVSVTDTGTGMAPEVVAKAFDPFFTTKPLGQGTGLGLSMIYGFARQSGGQVRIHTQLGQGTTVSLFLPRHLGLDGAEPQGRPSDGDGARATSVPLGKTVLVVDDEPSVRMVLVEVLADMNCTVLEAADSTAGLAILQSQQPLDLLVSDVGLPGGLNGRQLADAARVVRPGLKVLLVTGYAEAAVLRQGSLPDGMQVMTKPFTAQEVTARIRGLMTALEAP